MQNLSNATEFWVLDSFSLKWNLFLSERLCTWPHKKEGNLEMILYIYIIIGFLFSAILYIYRRENVVIYMLMLLNLLVRFWFSSFYLKISTLIKVFFHCYSNGLRSSPLLIDDCDPDVLGCSVAELSPTNAVELVDPSVTLWLCSDERPALVGRLWFSSKLTCPGREADDPVDPKPKESNLL